MVTRIAHLGALPATRGWPAHGWLHCFVLGAGLAVAACTPADPTLSVDTSASTVADYASSGCSTAVVIGLSKQIAEEANCEHPGDFVAFTATGGITFTSNAVLPYIGQAARDDLKLVAANNPLQVDSGLRTLAQQYLLYAWYLEGRCGITDAATVGSSNHEGGRAVDLANYSARVSAMGAHGWAHDVPGDPVHFDHTSSPDHRGEDVHAFQVLWNRNHPTDTIAEDGDYGPATEARLKAAPATGFAMGPSCDAPTMLAANVVSVTGPDMAPPATQVHYEITLKNSGTAAWPAATELQLAAGSASVLYDASWLSAKVITKLDAAVPVGQTGVIDFDVTTPDVTMATAITQHLELDDAGTTFGTFDLALTVSPDVTGPTSGEGGSGDAEGSDAGSGATGDGGGKSGGCSGTGGGGGGAGGFAGIALGLGLVAARRRRRRS